MAPLLLLLAAWAGAAAPRRLADPPRLTPLIVPERRGLITDLKQAGLTAELPALRQGADAVSEIAGGAEPASVIERLYEGGSFGPAALTGTPAAVPLSSPEGRMRLDRARAARFADESLIFHYAPQRRPTYCGVASACIVLGAFGDPGQEQDGLLVKKWPGKLETAVQGRRGYDPGFQLAQLPGLLQAQGLRATTAYAAEGEARRLRDAVRSALDRRAERKVIVNFLGSALGARSGGHFSPIAAYDPPTDSVLVLDTAAHKNEPFWIPVPVLHHAMLPLDGASGRPRGFVIVEK